MRKWLCSFALSLIASVSLASADEETAKRLFASCVQASDLFACDELVRLPELDELTRSNAFTARSMAQAERGDLTAAAQDLEEALRLDPANPMALRVRGILANMTEDRGIATDTGCFNEFDPQRLQACDQLVSKTAEDSPERAAALDGRAAALMDAERFDKAIADLTYARKLVPNQPQLVEHLMIAKYWSGDIAGSLKENEIALAFPGAENSGQLHQYRGSLLYLAGNLEDANREFTRAASAGPEFVIARYWAGVVRRELGSDATQIFRSLADDPIEGPFANALAKLRLGEASPEDVLREAALLTGATAKDALCLAHFHIGHQAWLAGDKRKAKEHFASALAGKRQRNLEYHAAKMLMARL